MKLYIASKSEHGPTWQIVREMLAEQGHQVICTWIDESAPGASLSMRDLWTRCIDEAAACDILVAVHYDGETWKGAFVEIGAALAAGKLVYVVGRPPGSWVDHPRVTFCSAIADAIADASGRCAL